MGLTWVQIARLGLVQMCLGAIVVLMTSTLNRLMTVEMALPAAVCGALVALHYGVQITRPAWGLRSDTQADRTRFIIGGMAVLGMGAWLAALALTLIPVSLWGALALSVLAYGMIGLGVGASGTSLLALLARATAPGRRAAAATITWLMMILGIALTAGVVGAMLDPYSAGRLLVIVGVVAVGAVVVTALAVAGIEARSRQIDAPPPATVPLRAGLAEVWAEPAARRFTLFVLLAMTAYFMQELILEPFAGLVFGLTPGETTRLSGAQNGGVFAGMLAVGIAATGLRLGSLRGWLMLGCLISAAALVALAALPRSDGALLVPLVVALGLGNGIFAVAAIGAMMERAGQGRAGREGARMGLWGAAQALAAGFGGLAGAASVDLLRLVLPVPAAFGTVFLVEAALFLAAAALGAQVVGAPVIARHDTDRILPLKGAPHGL